MSVCEVIILKSFKNAYYGFFLSKGSNNNQFTDPPKKRHQYLTLYQNWHRTPVYLDLAVSASYAYNHILCFWNIKVKIVWNILAV